MLIKTNLLVSLNKTGKYMVGIYIVDFAQNCANEWSGNPLFQSICVFSVVLMHVSLKYHVIRYWISQNTQSLTFRKVKCI